VPRYTNKRACDLKGLQEVIHVSRLSFFTHACTRNFFVSSLKERVYTYSMYLSTVKVGSDYVEDKGMKSLPLIRSPTLLDITRGSRYPGICRARDMHVSRTNPCWRCVRAKPRYRLCRRSKRRIPCERLLSTPDRRAYWLPRRIGEILYGGAV
jgi:hypothetical protein